MSLLDPQPTVRSELLADTYGSCPLCRARMQPVRGAQLVRFSDLFCSELLDRVLVCRIAPERAHNLSIQDKCPSRFHCKFVSSPFPTAERIREPRACLLPCHVIVSPALYARTLSWTFPATAKCQLTVSVYPFILSECDLSAVKISSFSSKRYLQLDLLRAAKTCLPAFRQHFVWGDTQ